MAQLKNIKTVGLVTSILLGSIFIATLAGGPKSAFAKGPYLLAVVPKEDTTPTPSPNATTTPTDTSTDPTTSADPTTQQIKFGPAPKTTNTCGKGDNAVNISFNIGCNQSFDNPILDALFALLRFASIGVGLVVIIFVIVGGIQFSASQGNPQATMAAIKRIRNALLALVIYIFIFALIQWLVPGGLF